MLGRLVFWTLVFTLTAQTACHRGPKNAAQAHWPASSPEHIGNVTPGALGEAGHQSVDRIDLEKRASDEWLHRDNRASLEAALNAYEKLATLSPEDPNLAIRLSRGYFLYGNTHLASPTERASRRQAFVRGMLFGEHALTLLNASLKEALKQGHVLEASLSSLNDQDMPAMMWYTANLASFARHSGVTTLMFYRSRLEGLIERMVALNEKFCYGAPRLFYALWLARAPTFIGGNIEQSKNEFEHALALAPDYFGNAYAYALNYAVPTRDRPLFRSLLARILAGQPNAVEDMIPEMRIAQDQAKNLLAREESLF